MYQRKHLFVYTIWALRACTVVSYRRARGGTRRGDDISLALRRAVPCVGCERLRHVSSDVQLEALLIGMAGRRNMHTAWVLRVVALIMYAPVSVGGPRAAGLARSTSESPALLETSGELVDEACSQQFPCSDDAWNSVGLTEGSSSDDGGGTGRHKPLLPLAAADIEAGVALLFGLALASAGGVGGGALVVPILMLLDGWEAGATVPFAQLCGFATAVPRFLMVVAKPHPLHSERPLIGARYSGACSSRTGLSWTFIFPMANRLITTSRSLAGGLRCILPGCTDFESFVVLTPSALIGNLVGIHLNVVAPSLLLLALMIVLLTYITFRTCRRGRKLWRYVP